MQSGSGPGPDLTDEEKEIINNVIARAEKMEAMEQERIGWELPKHAFRLFFLHACVFSFRWVQSWIEPQNETNELHNCKPGIITSGIVS